MTPILRLLTLILCLVPALALAQPKPDDVARTHYDSGKQLAAAGKYAEAYSEFEAGYAATPKAAFLFNMAEAARGMGDVAKARTAYERFLAAESTGSLADTARKRLGELPPNPPDAKPAAPPATAPTPAEAAKLHEDAIASRPMQPLPYQPEDKPIWKKWPFWAAVGGAVVTTVVIVAVASSGGGPSCGAGCIDLR